MTDPSEDNVDQKKLENEFFSGLKEILNISLKHIKNRRTKPKHRQSYCRIFITAISGYCQLRGMLELEQIKERLEILEGKK